MATNALMIDPYAAIRRLNFTYTPGALEQYGDGGDMRMSPDAWSTDFDALRAGGFQSKYNQVEQLPDGTLAVTLQQPGAHKYDTMRAIYAQGADGQWALQGEPVNTRSGGGFSLDPRDQIRNALLDAGVSDRIATGITRGPHSAAALMVNDIARGLDSAGVDSGFGGTLNREVLRNSEKDIQHDERGAGRAAAVMAALYGGSYLSGGEAAGGTAATQYAPATNAALAESAVGTGGYGASSAGAGGGATASWGAGAGYTADAANTANAANTMSNANNGTTLADFFSGNGNWNDYLRAGQAAYGMYAQDKATDAATAGNQAQMALMREMWQANQAENKPLVDMRNSVLPQISNLLQNPNSITQDPGYQFQLKQGQNQLDNRAAASGNYYSGAQQRAAQRYGQDYAGTKLDQSLNRLMGVATGTQVGSQNNQNANNQFAVSGGNALQQGGNIRAGGYIGQYNTANNNLNDWMQDQTNRKYWGGGG